MQLLDLYTETDFYQFFGKTEEFDTALQYKNSYSSNFQGDVIYTVDVVFAEEKQIVYRTYSNVLQIIANLVGLFNILQAFSKIMLKFFYT